MAKTFPDLSAEIHSAQNRLQQHRDSGLLDAADALQRSDYLDMIAQQYSDATRVATPTVFLSYAVENARGLDSESYRHIHDTPCSEHGRKFKVELGFRQTGDPDVLKHVRIQMRKCCLFVGLYTADFALDAAVSPRSYAPSGWVILEAGMAQGMGLPCVLLVEKGVHPDFWKKQLGQWRHVEFDQQNFKAALMRVSVLLQEHYDVLRKQHR